MMNRVLVTGGGGFVGSAIVRMLINKGMDVTVVGRNRYPVIEALGVRCLVGDIGDVSFVETACSGVDTVFHTAAKAGVWGTWKEYERTNITGTKNLITASIAAGVRRMVYTSTPSVVFNREDIRGGTEDLPYASSFLCHYARSKVIAEQAVLACNSADFSTCAIRPHLIFGPGDPHLIPRLIERGRKGALKIVGKADNFVDITYIDNVAQAHLLAAESLEKNGKAAGQSYFIGQERPVNLWDWINELFHDLDIPPVTRRVHRQTALTAGLLFECGYRLLRLKTEPIMTRFLAEQLSRSHFFSHKKAKIDLGYEPVITLEEGRRRLLDWLNDYENTNH